VKVVSQGVMALREEDPHVPATAAVYLASLVVHHATVRVREKVKARYVTLYDYCVPFQHFLQPNFSACFNESFRFI